MTHFRHIFWTGFEYMDIRPVAIGSIGYKTSILRLNSYSIKTYSNLDNRKKGTYDTQCGKSGS